MEKFLTKLIISTIVIFSSVTFLPNITLSVESEAQTGSGLFQATISPEEEEATGLRNADLQPAILQEQADELRQQEERSLIETRLKSLEEEIVKAEDSFVKATTIEEKKKIAAEREALISEKNNLESEIYPDKSNIWTERYGVGQGDSSTTGSYNVEDIKIDYSNWKVITPWVEVLDYVTLEPEFWEIALDTYSDSNRAKTKNLGDFLSQVFNFGIAIAVALSVVMITLGGIQYMTTDSWNKKEEGKERIRNALYGLGLALVSWLILYTINPNLVDFSKNQIVSPTTNKTAQ